MIDVSEDLSKLKNSKLCAQNLANYAYALIEAIITWFMEYEWYRHCFKLYKRNLYFKR